MLLGLTDVGESCAVPSHVRGLATPTLDSDLADDRRAMLESAADTFDPLKLYELEQSRDLAASVLDKNFPDPDTVVSIQPVEYRTRVMGAWTVDRKWMAGVDGVYGHGPTPADAVKAVLAAHKRATARVRPHPEFTPLESHTFEAFGQIAPADGPALLAFVTERMGVAYPLRVEDDGRVMLAKDFVSGPEAYDIGQALADLIHDRTPGAADAESAVQIVVEELLSDPFTGKRFKGFVVLASGERIDVPGMCPSRDEAHDWATRAKLAMRPTIAARAVVEAVQPHIAA